MRFFLIAALFLNFDQEAFADDVLIATCVPVSGADSDGNFQVHVLDNVYEAYSIHWKDQVPHGTSMTREWMKKTVNSDKEIYLKMKHGNRYSPFTLFQEDLMVVKIDKNSRTGKYQSYERFITSEPTEYLTRTKDILLKDCQFSN